MPHRTGEKSASLTLDVWPTDARLLNTVDAEAVGAQSPYIVAIVSKNPAAPQTPDIVGGLPSRTGLLVAIVVALAAAVVLSYVMLKRARRRVLDLARTQGDLFEQCKVLRQSVRDRTAELAASRAEAQCERERVESLLKDSNHRIGNSLATVSSLLGLQMMRAGSDDVRDALEAARQRVHAIASGHRRLFAGDALTTIDAADFLPAVVEDLQSTYAQRASIRFVPDFESIAINARDATTLGILAGELVTNAFKHAFADGRSGTIWVRLLRNERGVAMLEVADDGVGPAEGKIAGEGGLGSVIVKQLAQQFGGQPVYARAPEGGMVVTIEVPYLEQSGPVGPATV